MTLRPSELEPEVLAARAGASVFYFKASSAIAAAGIIVITGADDDHPTCALATSASLAGCRGQLWYTDTGVGIDLYGVARPRAVVTLDTSTATLGDPIFLSTAGGVSLTAGTIPVVVGQVLTVAVAGKVLINLVASSDNAVTNSGAVVTTASGNIVLTLTSPTFQFIDPGGANRDVTLPVTDPQKAFYFKNAADNAENLVIKNAGGDTIVTLNQNEAAWVANTGAAWAHGGVITIAQT